MMIWRPKVGQRVRLHYGKRYCDMMPLHGRVGVVRVAGAGPGPINAGVKIDGRIVTVPRGNLYAAKGCEE